MRKKKPSLLENEEVTVMQITWNNRKSKANFSQLCLIPVVVPLAREVHLKSEHQSCR